MGNIPQAFESTCEILEKIASEEVANAWRAPYTLQETSEVIPLFVKAGFQSVKLQMHQVTARYPSMEAFLHAHVDFFSAGRVDVDAILTLTRDKLESFCTASGVMHVPMEGYIVTALKD